MHLLSVRFDANNSGRRPEFPFSLPAFDSLDSVVFKSPVTFFVGENGSGKSTLLEAIACATEAIAAGSYEIADDESLQHIRPLASELKLEWRARPVRGLFVRAEDFFGYTKRLRQMRTKLKQEAEEIAGEVATHSVMARLLAESPFKRELQDLHERYGDDLDSHSHGESFMKFFETRLRPNYLHLLDEPEAPFSPSLQFTLMMFMKALVSQGAQFIIATHSPLLLSFPGASIYSMDRTPMKSVSYDDLEHVAFVRSFLNNPESYLRYLNETE